MKHILVIAVALSLPIFTSAQVQETRLQPAAATTRLTTGESLTLQKQIVAMGYRPGTVVASSKYTGSDETGKFEVELVAQEFKNAAGKIMEQTRIQITRGKNVQVINVADNGSQTYETGKTGLNLRASNCNALTCAKSMVKAGQSCAGCGNSIASCINQYKGKTGRVWKTIACLLSSCVKPCVTCVADFAKVIACVSNCKN